ncbi:uncharacterized protein V6R79_011511 [Siganus canaliculatus]
MDEVNFLCAAVGRCVDASCLLLDLLVRTFTWLLGFVSGVGTSLHKGLIILSESTLLEYWNFLLFSFLTASEAVSSTASGYLHVLDAWLQMLGGVLESFKMVGHLSCHVAWRIKDVLHRGLISGSGILRQACDGLYIALSLVLYFINTVVNVVLISMQNFLSVLMDVWEIVANPVERVVELTLTVLTFLYSCLVGASVLLWTSCQLLLDFLGALGRVLFTVFMVDSHGLLLSAALCSLAVLFLNHRLSVLAGWLRHQVVSALPGAHGVRMVLHDAVADQVHPNTTRLSHTEASNTAPSLLSANEPNQPDSVQLQQAQQERTRTSRTSRGAAAAAADGAVDGGGGRGPTQAELLVLLKEQEERKKCVICQDLSKTVLLLPCRHLCLCRHCADILTQRPNLQQRCCPLCRQPITQTVDVFL